ncbi:MAG: alpha/beta fold hydrolase [Desulfobacterales bacterium]|nr:alpha/beta fold hydrolase [Desulfobacterales bacterium]MBT7698390.1 alpha/beta fold hydrolase [Desulfobacterales bacterium]
MNNDNPVDISSIKHLYPFESRYLEINGLKYHYLDEGEGEPVVMIHGNPTWSFYFRELISDLSSEYRTIAVDHIGCGLSDKPRPDVYDYRLENRVDDIENLIDSLDLKERITLVLHDWGGMIGMAYALRHPEKIARIIITNTAAFFPPSGNKIPFRLWVIRNILPFATIGVLGFNLFAEAASFMCSKKGLKKDVKKGLKIPYNSWKNRIATLKFVQDIPLTEKDPSYSIVKSVEESLHTLSDIPKLICWGMHDFVFDSSYLAEWERRFPNAEVHRFINAGHYVLEDEPDKIVALAKNFLKKHPV